MVDTPATEVAVAPSTPKKSPIVKKVKKTTRKPKLRKKKPSSQKMVYEAVKELSERKGSSFRGIKNYIIATYKIDADKMGTYIKRALKASVEAGILAQFTGQGANGRYKLAVPERYKYRIKPTIKPKISKSARTKKDAKSKKSLVKKSPAKPKSPSKVKKTTKVPTKKPKSPKAKTVKKTVKSPKKK